MAGAGYKLFNTGDVLTAAQVNTYLQEQAVMRFANATARTTALSGVLAEGMMSYLDDTNAVEVYDGSAWVSVGSTGDITGVTAGTGISGGGTSGTVTITNSMATAIDAKGDLIVGTGADTFSRLAVGATNGHVLTVDSGEATGMKWASAGGGDFKLIETLSPSSASSATFTSGTFSSTYDAYVVRLNLRGSLGTITCQLRNAGSTITAGNYARYGIGRDEGGSAITINGSSQTSWLIGYGDGFTEFNAVLNFILPTDTNQRPVFNGLYAGVNSGGTGQGMAAIGGGYVGTQAFDSLVISGTGTFTGTISAYGLVK